MSRSMMQGCACAFLVANVVACSSSDDGSGNNPQAETLDRVASQQVTLQAYYANLETVRNAISGLPDLHVFDGINTSTGWFDKEIALSLQAYDVIAAMNPPDAISTVHFELLNIMEGRALVDTWIRGQVPATATVSEGEPYQYRTPDIGLLRGRLEAVDCHLDAIAKQGNLAVATYGPNCLATLPPSTPTTLGSATAPVSTIQLKSNDLMVGNPGQQIPAPDLSFGYSTIYAKAGRITLTYDNENPAPYKHNAVVYRNATGTDLQASEIVGGTPGGSGPATNTIDFTLDPGDYSIVCNVHIAEQQTKLVVVP